MENTISLLSSVTAKSREPLINIAAFHDLKTGWTVYLFPRGKHRPQVFYTGELTVSPASIDLCGIFVAPLEKDFARISGDDIALDIPGSHAAGRTIRNEVPQGRKAIDERFCWIDGRPAVG